MASGPEQKRFVWLGSATLHSRRADRHPRNRKPRCIWLLSKEPLESDRRHVAFDHIRGDLRRMTSRQICRYAQSRFSRVEVRRLNRPDGETGFLQMPNPACAASAIGVFM